MDPEVKEAIRRIKEIVLRDTTPASLALELCDIQTILELGKDVAQLNKEISEQIWPNGSCSRIEAQHED